MHEIVFSQQIIKALNDKLKNLDTALKTISVNVLLSPLSHVRPETLKETFSQMVKLEKFNNIGLNIKPSRVELECKFCSKKVLTERPIFACPSCKSETFDIKQGQEFIVESIEVKDQGQCLKR